jgi:phosphoribosylamine--glycine ligase
MKMIYQGTTKDLIKIDDRTYFIFKDTYSIFDWGKMPNTLEEKGFYLCQISADIFNYLGNLGFKHNMLDCFNNQMQIEHFDSGEFINLEVIFRFGVPAGSSLLQRGHEAGEEFSNPLIEFTTKRERIDRLLDLDEAREISGLSSEDFNAFYHHIEKCALALKEYFKVKGIKLWDGKFEFAMRDGEFFICDSIGIDELRLSYEKTFFSKEALRKYYKNTAFYREVSKYKSEFKDLDNTKIQSPPKPLPKNMLEHYTELYKASYKAIVQNNNTYLKNWCEREELNQIDSKVLIIGDGGREHCLAKRIAESPLVSEVILQTKRENLFSEFKTINLNDTELIHYCKENLIELVIIGPEKPLCEGLADRLRNENISTLGPGFEGAQLEASKIMSKNFMQKYEIPCAKSFSFNNYQSALKFLLSTNMTEVVIKIDGLASGKGVSVCKNLNIAKNELKRLELEHPESQYLIEEVLKGKEVSLFYLIDHNEIKFLGDACDHKRLMENDLGPNTGGMGTYSPCDWLDPQVLASIQYELKAKLKTAIANEKLNYNGVLFVGLMVDNEEYNVLEFNVRLGDPETQVLLPRLDVDLFVLFNQCAHNLMDEKEIIFKDESFVHVVCASENYPYKSGQSVAMDIINLPQKNINSDQFEFIMAGMKKENDTYFTSGGRVCGLTAKGKNKELARLCAYQALNNIKFNGMKYRNDIAK